MKKTYQRLPESELDIMLVLWNNTPPMTRPEIEKVINMKKKLASTTILRAITHKSFEFNNQYYSIKEMFIHSGTFIKNDKAIKKEITQIIEKENKLKPYSDEKIRKLLEEKDIYISRRTVTKYREECFIYNSRQRKIEKILWEEK